MLIIFCYELFFGGINVKFTRYDIERYQGGYADVMNYAIYISCSFLIICYFKIFRKENITSVFKSARLVVFVSLMCILGLIKINHVSSYAVFAGLAVLFFFELFKASRVTLVFIIIALFIVYSLYGNKLYRNNIEPLIEKDIEVVEGDRAETQLFHGRMARWEELMTTYQNSSGFAMLFGMPFSLTNTSYMMTTSHNDYLRIMFATGIIGLISYILYLLNIFSRLRFLKLSEHYLLMGALVILLLYSVTTVPTLYYQLMYVIFSVFAYVSLPKGYLTKN